jgi:hypothetical protein
MRDPLPPPRAYVRTVSPRLNMLLLIVLGLVAVLSANSIYLAAITFIEWLHRAERVSYQNYLYQLMFVAHLVLGLVLIVPFVAFGFAHLAREPIHYPFAYRTNALLQYVNQQLVKAKPAFHKRTFLKPFMRTAGFCSTCHKVSLPRELNHYKDFLRGQNHYDTFLLSGVSGVSARSFYYPEKA